MALLSIEYLMMLYCTLRLVDYKSFIHIFDFQENFLDVEKLAKKVAFTDSQSIGSQHSTEAEDLAATHVYIVCIVLAIFVMVVFCLAA